MKIVAKIFTILALIAGIISCLLLVGIPILIVAAIALKKMKTATCKKDMTVIAILSIIFGNLVGGIAMLLTKDSDYATVEAVEAPVEE